MTDGIVQDAALPRPSMNLVSIFCADHVALASWYQEALGFPEIEELTSPVFTALVAGRVALGFHHDDAYNLLGLDAYRAHSGVRVHCTFDAGTPAEIDAAADRLRAAGARLIKEPFDTYYGARQIVFADPEGNVMRLSTPQAELEAVLAGAVA